MSGKDACKFKLQQELGFRTSMRTPLIGYIGRLDFQKGPDIALEAVPWMASMGCQMIMLGCGDKKYEDQIKLYEDEYR